MGELESKYDSLLRLLQRCGKIAVAYSGGVDSSLLLHAAVEALGTDRVIALYLLSELNAPETIEGSRRTFRDNFAGKIELGELAVRPLEWTEFVANDEQRCYHCKKRMYTILLRESGARGFGILADGTNADDLLHHRPGLQAIRELRIKIPLVDAGLGKAEIRELARHKGLTNFNLPSNSCLATRIPSNRKIDRQVLNQVASGERVLHQLGFAGCRVRVLAHSTLVEVLVEDLPVIADNSIKALVAKHFSNLGLAPLVVSRQGREGILLR